MMKAFFMVLSMLAVGVLVWRALQRQDAADSAAEPADGSPTATTTTTTTTRDSGD